MFGFVKMSALSAVLSFGVVTAYNHEPAVDRTGGAKLYQDRAPVGAEAVATTGSVSRGLEPRPVLTGGHKGSRLALAPCESQTWPYVAQACLSRTDGREIPGRVRVITVEMREGSNTSVLQRIPQTDIARR
jgi:hypothetical protein